MREYFPFLKKKIYFINCSQLHFIIAFQFPHFGRRRRLPLAAAVYLALLALVRADAEPDADPAADPAASPDAAAAAAADPAADPNPSAALPSFGASYGGHTAQLPAHGGYGAPPPRKQVWKCKRIQPKCMGDKFLCAYLIFVRRAFLLPI